MMNTTSLRIESAWVDIKQVETYYFLAVCLILTVVLNIGLVVIIWKRCSHGENYIPQNLIMYGAGFSNVMASIGALVYIIRLRKKDNCDKRSDDLVYFVAFPGLIIRELLTACFAINRYAVCVYGLTYHLKMSAKKISITLCVLCVALYTCLIAIHQINRNADSNVLVSHTVPFKITWATCEIVATSLLCFFNLLLYILAKSKARRSRRVRPEGNAGKNETQSLFMQNIKRMTGTLFVSLFYATRMLPHAINLIISVEVPTHSVEVAAKTILLIKFILGVMDPIVQCLSIKMIKEGLRAEWVSMKNSLINFF